MLRITGKNIRITPAIKSYIERKFNRVIPYLNNFIDAHIFLKVTKKQHEAEVLINADHKQFVYSVKTNDLYSSIDKLIDKTDRQLAKYKEKITHHHYKNKNHKKGMKNTSRSKTRLNTMPILKPMTIKEAILRLDIEKDNHLLFTMINANKPMVNDNDLKRALLFKSKEGFFHLIVHTHSFFRSIFGRKKTHLMEYIYINSNNTPQIIKRHRLVLPHYTYAEAVASVASVTEHYLVYYNTELNLMCFIYQKGKRKENHFSLELQ